MDPCNAKRRPEEEGGRPPVSDCCAEPCIIGNPRSHQKSLVGKSQLQNCAVEGFFPRRGRKKGGKSGYRQLKAGKMKGLATIHSDTQDEYYL